MFAIILIFNSATLCTGYFNASVISMLRKDFGITEFKEATTIAQDLILCQIIVSCVFQCFMGQAYDIFGRKMFIAVSFTVFSVFMMLAP
jgi:hypothetical protein